MAELNRYSDGSEYGDSSEYNDVTESAVYFIAKAEVKPHYLATRISFQAQLDGGGHGGFRIHSVRLAIATTGWDEYSHRAFIDQVTPSTHLAVVVRHSGSDFRINHVQLTAQRKRHQQVG